MLLMAVFNVAFTLFASPVIGYWAPAVGYVASIALGNGAFMNWYYHRRVGLGMLHFWRRNLPVLAAGTAVTAACLVASRALPVSDWASFFAWGAAYTVIFGAVLWLVVLDKDERHAVAERLPFLR